ncbi:DUF1896 family protein [Phocaeicola plebeius]|jgi:hypothetical protein|uniref:DUF1896 family protein n=1 Tax=Phocaeicola plebeius TaxID=310297 RepID=A0A3E4VW74_9BACT|nr:DUF1896 family protein [Phocaeicola plebeius]RGM34191.1 DUF1896 family protein [Phocaeicola plebeius]
MVHSKYYKELKQYLEDYHPNLVKDEEFITTRSELAQETFIECSREGMNIEECQNEVNEVLYSGLHFSLYQLVEDIIEEMNLSFSDKDKFIMQMFLLIQPIAEKYKLDDNFERTSEYDKLYTEISQHINQYIKDYELQ